LFISLIYLVRQDFQRGLAFLSLLWGLYALSRVITIFTEGALGAFGTQWLLTEAVFFVIASLLYVMNKKTITAAPVN
jgi:predicted membrane channel-forming protein YqfA (hemolysin III family)